MQIKLIVEQISLMVRIAREYRGDRYQGMYGVLQFSGQCLLRLSVLLWRTVVLQLLRIFPIREQKYLRPTVAILLSHNRPGNMEFIVRTLLTLPEVKRIVVSNSNKNIQIADWIHCDEQRITLIDESRETFPGHRIFLASKFPSQFYVSIDDDYFLSPYQIRKLISKIQEDPSVPHGIRGDNYSVEGETVTWLSWADRPKGFGEVHSVDTLIGVYAFSSTHVEIFFTLAVQLGFSEPSKVRSCDDIILSACGDGLACSHEVGYVLDCISSYIDGVALHRSIDTFDDERAKIFCRLKELKKRLIVDIQSNK